MAAGDGRSRCRFGLRCRLAHTFILFYLLGVTPILLRILGGSGSTLF